MADALTPVLATGALVLCIAGVAKLRAPASTSAAARTLGLPHDAMAVRAFALLELALGGWCLASPSRLAALSLAAGYALFGVLSLLLARRRAACGCFGESDAPASPIQALLSAALALAALAAAARVPHGVGWLLDRAPAELVVLAAGTAAAAYGIAVAYAELPRAWGSWSGR